MFKMRGIHMPRYKNDGCTIELAAVGAVDDMPCWEGLVSGSFPAVQKTIHMFNCHAANKRKLSVNVLLTIKKLSGSRCRWPLP